MMALERPRRPRPQAAWRGENLRLALCSVLRMYQPTRPLRSGVFNTPQGAYTLLELMVSLSTASVLAAGLASSILLATRAAAPDKTAVWTLEGTFSAEDLASEMRSALYFPERTATTVQFMVADRNADGAPEKIRYAWSGTAGTPLTRSYNDETAVHVLENVNYFAFDYSVQATTRRPRVMLVVDTYPTLTSQDAAKKSLLEWWGYRVAPVTDSSSQGAFDNAVASADVAYISEEIMAGTLNTKLRLAPIGVVIEECLLDDDFGLCNVAGSYDAGESQVFILDNTHYITTPFSTGLLTITDVPTQFRGMHGTLAAGLTVLAQDDNRTYTDLAVIETGAALFDGTKSSGRRVVVPYASDTFELSQLNDNGVLLMKRAIEWAAGSYEVTGVTITLQKGSSSEARIVTRTEIVNRPRVSGA